MKPVIVAPLVALALAGGATGAYLWVTSSGGEEEVVVQPTPTPTATATTVPSLTATAVSSPTPSPLPGGKAPEGCVSTEKPYVDPDGRFAFCYPSDMELTTADTGDGSVAANVAHLGDENAVIMIYGLRVEPYEPCGIDTPTTVRNQRIDNIVIDGKSAQACFQDHYDRAQPDVLLYKSIDLMIRTNDGRPVIVLATYSGPDFQRAGVPLERVVMRGLESLAVG